MRRLSHVGGALAACSVVLIATQSRAATYTAAFANPPGYQNTIAYGVDSPSVAGSGIHGGGFSHAFVYDYVANTEQDLNPAGYQFSVATGVSGSAGGLGQTAANVTHAFFWNGTAASAVDLNPAGFARSQAFAITGGSQVGVASSPSPGHAMLWNGTAASAVDLHPAGFGSTFAQGVWSTTQVGWGGLSGSSSVHALMWSGTAASVVDLHPAGYANSMAMAAGDGSQAGFGTVAGVGDHALLWTGSAASAVDLHPAGTTQSQALAVAGDMQAGYAQTTQFITSQRAYAWNGTAASAVDLHQYLSSLDFSALFPGQTITLRESQALGVDDDGVIVGYVRFDSNTGSGQQIGVRLDSGTGARLRPSFGDGGVRARLSTTAEGTGHLADTWIGVIDAWQASKAIAAKTPFRVPLACRQCDGGTRIGAAIEA